MPIALLAMLVITTVLPPRKIKKEALEKHLAGGYNADATTTQVANGKHSILAFGENLDLMTLMMLQTGLTNLTNLTNSWGQF